MGNSAGILDALAGCRERVIMQALLWCLVQSGTGRRQEALRKAVVTVCMYCHSTVSVAVRTCSAQHTCSNTPST